MLPYIREFSNLHAVSMPSCDSDAIMQLCNYVMTVTGTDAFYDTMHARYLNK